MRLHVTARMLIAGSGDGPIKKFALESPVIGERTNAISIRCMGWFIAESVPVHAVVARSDAIFEWRTRPVPRLDVARAFAHEPEGLIGGFELTPMILGLGSQAKLTIWADLGDRLVALAEIEIAITSLALSYKPRFRPLLLSCGGRVGGSVTMAALSSHPEILSQGPIPYEEKPALYWIHAARVLSNPANHIHSEKRFGFEHEEFHVGFSPFHCNDRIDAGLPHAGNWHRSDGPLMAFDFAKQAIDSFYGALAVDRNKEGASTFLEKASIGPLSIIMREVYPEAREIFLVRDPRDTVRSILDFNRKRGFPDFHAEKFESIEDHVKFLAENMAHWMRHYGARRASTLLVRYEDLILDPTGIAHRIFDYAGLSSGQGYLDAFTRIFQDSFSENSDHTTSASPEHSIGRWRDELPADLQALCNKVFAETLAYFEYR